MQELFRTDESEMFSILNGIYMSTDAESRLDKGFYVLVPDVKDQTDLVEMRRWYDSNPRDYKIRILAKTEPDMLGPIYLSSDLKWEDLDNKKVQFRSDHRP